MNGDEGGIGRPRGNRSTPAFQVIVLGSGGGPLEDNCTGFLVRSTATDWAKGSILAVDAGTGLAAISRILQESASSVSYTKVQKESRAGNHYNSSNGAPNTREDLRSSKRAKQVTNDDPNQTAPDPMAGPNEHDRPEFGPFSGARLPFQSADANAAYITRELISTYLLTHPHLDHISAFVINTPSFQFTSKPKRLAAPPATIDAIKAHVFNEVIWPNLSDEDGGVGLISYTRLNEGGSMQLGEGEGRGYITICDGLGVKCFCVTHQTYTKRQSHRGSNAGLHHEHGGSVSSPRVATPSADPERVNFHGLGMDRTIVIDSTAYFIRDEHSGKEILMFGDIEPDSLSLFPRTAQVWAEAAPKIAAGMLTGVFMECSYDNSQSDATLFGHLAPRHVIEELKTLAARVTAVRAGDTDPTGSGTHTPSAPTRVSEPRKRRRSQPSSESTRRRDSSQSSNQRSRSRHPLPRNTGTRRTSSPVSALDGMALDTPGVTVPTSHPIISDRPLQGLQVVIIHMKDTLRDKPVLGTEIMRQLQEYEKDARLGCEFIVSQRGTSVWM
ncbi:MAG: 3',5'-cyclic-nucleotide phosphodiesterase pde1 [Piccolia ochrophora]|nr:MAG: 3',5'-cyclic-nucleotide phosphodiesterase pde1 [Piccolia ochrophora]